MSGPTGGPAQPAQHDQILWGLSVDHFGVVALKAHLWVPAVLFVLFLYLVKKHRWRAPGPREIFLCFGAILTVEEAKHIFIAVVKQNASLEAWALVFSIAALLWLAFDAVKLVYRDLRPRDDDDVDVSSDLYKTGDSGDFDAPSSESMTLAPESVSQTGASVVVPPPPRTPAGLGTFKSGLDSVTPASDGKPKAKSGDGGSHS